MAGNEYPFIKQGEQQHPPENAGPMTRVYPIDDYTISPEILAHATRYHFIKVPLIGQFNPLAGVDNWCGRTSSSMLWNYHQLAAGKVKSRDDYISQWRGPDGKGQMNLRFPSGDIAFVLPSGEYAFLGQLDKAFTAALEESTILPDAADRNQRLRDAERIRSSLDDQRKHLGKILQSLADNNPTLIYTGMSTSYGGHIILICGFCEMPDSDGSIKLWLLIADPSPPKLTKGPMCTSVGTGDEDDCKYLSNLKEGHNALVSIVKGDWLKSRGFLYLVRASKFFERNTFAGDRALWMDDFLNKKPGGYIIHKPTPTPLDPRLVLTKNVISSICFPLQENPYVLSSPIRYFAQAETAGTGFYPLGSNQALHGGIHLPPASSDHPVRSIAPGYIVAARLSKNPATTPVLDFLSSHNGFVLVRHEAVEPHQPDKAPANDMSAGDTQAPAPKPLPFYSLYMHMPPTDWPKRQPKEPSKRQTQKQPGPPDLSVEVPWLRRFYLARQGAVVNLSAERGQIGQIFWSAADLPSDGNADECEIHASLKDLDLTQKWKLRGGNRYLGYAKRPPGDLKQGYKALQAGAVVTFSSPFLNVGHGDVLGLIQPDARLESHGCLHWEILAPTARDNAIEKAWKLAKKLALKLPELAEAGDGKDNLLEEEELEELLLEKLPTDKDKEEATLILAAIKKKSHTGFKNAMSRFIGSTSTFAELPANQQLTEPTLSAALTRAQCAAMKFYAITLNIDNKSYRVAPEKDRRLPFPVTIKYLVRGTNGQADRSIAEANVMLNEEELEKPLIKLHLKVPADADAIDIITPHFHLDASVSKQDEVRTSLARSLLAARWRGVVLKHTTEWSLDGLKKLVHKLCEEDLLETPPGESDKAFEEVKPTAWYGIDQGKLEEPPEDGQKQASASPKPHPVVEIPVLGRDGQEASLFDERAGMLPRSGEVLNVHPVTFLWLLKLLQENNDLNLVTEFTPDASGGSGDVQNGDTPQFWGWFPHDSKPTVVGKPLSVVSIRRDWGHGPVKLVAEQLGGNSSGPSREIELAAGKYKDGVFSATVVPYFWGQWKLKHKGHENATPQTQGGVEAPVIVTVPEPRLAESFAPQKEPKTGLYGSELHFLENCPESLAGYLVYQFTKVALPLGKEFPEAEHWQLDDETAGYIVGLKKGAKNVTTHYTLSDYLNASDNAQRVSVDLCRAVESFRKASKTRLRVIDLSEDGRTATLEAPSGAKLDALLACASGQQPNAYDTGITVSEHEEEGPKKRKKKVIRVEFSAMRTPRPLRWQDASHGNHVYATRLTKNDGPLVEHEGFLTGLQPKKKDAKVSASFWWSSYRKVASTKDFKLSKHLADQVEALRSHFGKPLRIETVSEDGLSVGVRCNDWEKKKASLETAARALTYQKQDQVEPSFIPQKLAFVELVSPSKKGQSKPPRAGAKKGQQEKKREVLMLSVEPPELSTSGWLCLDFDPRDIFAALLRQAAPTPDERVWLKMSFLAPNGRGIEAYEGPNRSLVQAPGATDAAGGLRAGVEGVFKTLAQPGFESVRVTVVGQKLAIRIPLRGSKADWLNAKPVILVDKKPYPVKPNSTGLELLLPLTEQTRDRVEVEANITNPEAMFDGERIAIAPVRWSGSTIPVVGPLRREEEEPGKLTFRARALCFPTRALPLKLRCTLVSSPLQQSPLAGPKDKRKKKKKFRTEFFVRNAHVTYEKPDLNGEFGAELDVSTLEPGATYRFELVPGTPDGKFAGGRAGPLHLDYTAPALEH
ncbi:hypothetical protein [Archangium violaceum]|uniref:Uncharacterized protein n=1 Tax=Archangium violaceum Cb vi76 TaxID=1406225 RepID=A0A084SGT6_9BACT|nr:hypothetical protein [Archangium violaceum]KFA87671.1 hypothetical protein Q664_46125 [Archangium violaceum Cb vi76]